MSSSSLVKGAWDQELYYRIWETAREWERFRRGNSGVQTQELRWLLARPDWDLHGPKTREEADIALSHVLPEELSPIERQAERGRSFVWFVRWWLEGLGVAPLDEDHECSQRAFVGYLNRLVDNRLLRKLQRGRYTIHPLAEVRKVLQTSNVRERPLSLDGSSRAVGLNLPPKVSDTEERILDRVGDLLEIAAGIVSLIQAGPERERLPADLREPGTIRGHDPTRFTAREGVEFALMIGSGPMGINHRQHPNDREEYEAQIGRLRSRLDEVVSSWKSEH